MQTYKCTYTNAHIYTHTQTIVILLFVHSGTDKEHPGDLKISCGDEETNACQSTVPAGGLLLLASLLGILVKGGGRGQQSVPNTLASIFSFVDW